MANYKINSETGVTMFQTYKHRFPAVRRMAKLLANEHNEEMTIINTRTNNLVRIIRPTGWNMRDI